MNVKSLNEQWSNLTEREKTLSKILCLFTVVGLVLFLFLKPFIWNTLKDKVVLRSLDQKINTDSGTLTSLTAQVPQSTENKKLSDRIMDSAESSFSLFIDHLTKMQSTAPFEITSVSVPNSPEFLKEATPNSTPVEINDPQNNNSSLPFKSISIGVKLQTSYANLGQYLQSLNSLPIFYKLTSMEIKKNQDILDVTFFVELIVLEKS